MIDDGKGGDNYDVIAQDAQGTIEQAALTLIAATDIKVYDGKTLSSGTVTSSGLLASDTVTASQAFTRKDAAGTNGSTLAVQGDYGIEDGNGGGNYKVTLQNAQGTITPMGIEIVANSLTKDQGAADPELTYRLGSNPMIDGDSLTGALTRAEGTTPGDYEIRQGTLSASTNYSLAFVPGTLTIKSSGKSTGGSTGEPTGGFTEAMLTASASVRDVETSYFTTPSPALISEPVSDNTSAVSIDDRIKVEGLLSSETQ